jgi:hypothetical protein
MELRQHASSVRPAHAAHLQLETADCSVYSHFGSRGSDRSKIMSIPIGGFAFAARNWREEDETEGSQDNSDRKCSMNAEGSGVDTGFGLYSFLR